MSWISQFARARPRAPDYAQKRLAAYRMGMRAGGSIEEIRVLVGEDSCAVCRVHADRVFTPDDAPILPLADCTHPAGCRCIYTLAMKLSPSRGEDAS